MTRPPGTHMTPSPDVLFDRLLDIMRRLRGAAGCPWDREQTRTSLKPYLIEETYEVLEAIESGRAEALREELGDLLFQVVFHAEIAADRVKFDWPDAGAAWGKVEEELREAGDALAGGDRGRFADELGDVLFSLVNVARLSSLDAEDVLQGAIEKFRRRFTTMEDELSASGKSVASVSPEELERSWDAAKAQERSR